MWYPIGNVGGVTEATRESTLGLEQNGDNLEINLQVTRPWQAGESRLFIWERLHCLELGYQELPALAPGVPYQTVIPLQGHALGSGGCRAMSMRTIMCWRHMVQHRVWIKHPPEPHLGYGINVRDLATLDALVAPLGVGWIRLWDEYSGIPATCPALQRALQH